MSGWGKVPRDAFTDARLTRRDLRVFGVLCNHADGSTGMCRVKQETIATEIESDRVGVNRSIKRLVAFGYVSAQKRAGMRRSLDYRVILGSTTPGQAELFAADEAPRSAKRTTAIGGQKATSDEASRATSDVASEATPIEQTLINRLEPVGSAQLRARDREAANDLRVSEPVPTRTEQAGAALPKAETSGAVPISARSEAGAALPIVDEPGAVPDVAGSEADAVPFLAPNLPPSDARKASRELETRLRDAAAGAVSEINLGLADTSEVYRWIAAGCDLELDILPTIAGIATRRRASPVKTWRYFEEAVLEASRRRRALEAALADSENVVVFGAPTGGGGGREKFIRRWGGGAGHRPTRAEQIDAAFDRLQLGEDPDGRQWPFNPRGPHIELGRPARRRSHFDEIDAAFDELLDSDDPD